MLTSKQIDNRVKKLETIEAEIKALEDQADAVKAELKAELEAQNAEELKTLSGMIIRWKTVISNRFDSKAFKVAEPALYAAYTRETASKRFTIA